MNVRRLLVLPILFGLCVTPAASQQDEQPSYWLQRIYEKTDDISEKVDTVGESQAELRQKFEQLRAMNQSEIETLTERLDSFEGSLEAADIKQQSDVDWWWDQAGLLIVGALGALLSFSGRWLWIRVRQGPSTT